MSLKRKPELGMRSGGAETVPCASAPPSANTSDAATIAALVRSEICNVRAARFNAITSHPDHALVQPGEGVERGEDCALLPSREVGRVFAGEHDPAVDLAQVVVVSRPGLVRPVARTAERERHAVPSDGNTVF